MAILIFPQHLHLPLQPATVFRQGYERGGEGQAARTLSRVRRRQLRAHREERVPHDLRRAAGVSGGGGQDLPAAGRGPGRNRHPAGVHPRLPRPLRRGHGVRRRASVHRLGDLREETGRAGQVHPEVRERETESAPVREAPCVKIWKCSER